MKKSLIELGRTYHNGKKGRFYSERKIVGQGPEYQLYSGQENGDCLRYQVAKGHGVGSQGNITRISFATWAKGTITEQ